MLNAMLLSTDLLVNVLLAFALILGILLALFYVRPLLIAMRYRAEKQGALAGGLHAWLPYSKSGSELVEATLARLNTSPVTTNTTASVMISPDNIAKVLDAIAADIKSNGDKGGST